MILIFFFLLVLVHVVGIDVAFFFLFFFSNHDFVIWWNFLDLVSFLFNVFYCFCLLGGLVKKVATCLVVPGEGEFCAAVTSIFPSHFCAMLTVSSSNYEPNSLLRFWIEGEVER